MERVRRSLAAKLLLGQLLVIAVGSLTLLLVALGIGPGIFRRHVREALGVVPADVARHLDTAFSQATLISLGIATAAALVVAIAVSWFVSVRVARPIQVMAAAAQRVSRGAHEVRVPVEGRDELGVLAGAFNDMAASLEAAEHRRRELLADVAHELRTPLATLEGYLEGIADGVLPADPATVSALRAETRRIERLIEDLAKVSRAEARQLDLRLQATPPTALVGAAVTAAAPAYAAKGVQLEQRAQERLPTIALDRDRMGEVLANLLENALRHTPAGGRVEVSASRRDDEVRIVILDSGEGIPREHLERVFERFYRVDPSRSRAAGGSGIGLAIVRAIVEAHGGRIHAESAGPGRGASFVVSLPAGDRGHGAPTGGIESSGHADDSRGTRAGTSGDD